MAHVVRLDNWQAKGRGVIGLPKLAPGEGLWLPGVSAIHTLFVIGSLDLLFLDEDGRCVRPVEAFPAWRPLAWARGARDTIELGAGTLSRFDLGACDGDRYILRSDDE